MKSKYEELFDLSEQKIKKAKELMKELSGITDNDKKRNIEAEIESLLKESDQLSKIAEKIGTSKH